MKLVRVDELTGNEILARPIINEGYFEILAEGTRLKTEYISKLKEFGITEVFILEDIAHPEYVSIIRDEVSDKCRKKIYDILSRHTFFHDDKSSEVLGSEVEVIVDNILDEEKVVEQLYDIRERSSDIYEHSVNICAMAMLIALKMELKRERVRDIGIGCLLHDIGLRYIPFLYEGRHVDTLTDHELEEYKKHTIYGYSALENEKWINKESLSIILSHHERLDGSGYPLKSTEGSNGVRIAAVCDFFDEAICGIGQERKNVTTTLELLKKDSKKFDSDVLKIFFNLVAVYPSGSIVETSDGDKAVVIRQNRGFPDKPVIQLLTNKFGTKYGDKEVLDLLAYNNIKIINVID